MSEELLLLLVEVWARLIYRLSSFICGKETAEALRTKSFHTTRTLVCVSILKFGLEQRIHGGFVSHHLLNTTESH